MYNEYCKDCKYALDIDEGNKHLLGSRWSFSCGYYPKTTRNRFRKVCSIKNCKFKINK